MTYGTNHLRDGKTIHAELDAILKLPQRYTKKKLKVTMIVIRLSNGLNKFSNSKCCIKCIENIILQPEIRGYQIQKVHYSTADGLIETKTPLELLEDPNYHTTRYYQNRNYKPRLKA